MISKTSGKNNKTASKTSAKKETVSQPKKEKVRQPKVEYQKEALTPKSIFDVRPEGKGKNKEFAIIFYLFMAIFILMIGYFIYFMAFKSEDIISHARNPRLASFSEHVVRGDILSEDGVVLATTKSSEDGTETRIYPYDDMFAHVVGYNTNGNYGVESAANFSLLRSHSFFLTQIWNDLQDKKNQGDSVVTTLDFDVQEAAYNALGDRRGAVIVIEVETGKIISMVSKPDFNPNTIAANWEDIVADESRAALLNRASQGLYPPGSTFKIVTALEFLSENGMEADYVHDCEGEVTENGTTIHCYNNKVHGEENLDDAFSDSCNTAFSKIGLELNINKWQTVCSKLLFNNELPTKIDYKQSRFSLTAGEEAGKIMQTAIGQGDTLVTPLHMAMLTAAIANDGEMMETYVIDSIIRDNGSTVKSYSSSSAGLIISEKEAKALQSMMEQVVAEGTASKLSGQSYSAAGKTGSAEYDAEGNSHGWFVGYASKESYNDIAIAVLVENGDSGSGSAVPVAKKVFDVYFNQK